MSLAFIVWLSSLGSTAPRLAWSDEAAQPGPSVEQPWTLQVMPTGLLYRSYLAGAKEPRFASFWSTDSDQGDLWDAALGGR